MGSMQATQGKKQVLIIDRDVAGIEPLRQRLSESGLIVRLVTDAAAALTSLAEQPPQLLMLDWDLPGVAAYEMIRNIREVRAPQVMRLIIVSALAGEERIVSALNLGADDFIVKPFSMREAVARVAGVLRAAVHPESRGLLRFLDLELDSSTHRVTAHGVSIQIRGIEYRLLEFLVTHSGRTFNRNQLLSQIWGGDTEVDERTVDVNVQRLRRLLSPQGYDTCIQTVRGFGYRLAAPSASAIDG